MTARVSAGRELTIPSSILELAGLDAGDEVRFLTRADGVVEILPEKIDIMSLFGVLKSEVRGVTIEDMNQAIEAAAGRL
jgi:bifunctional DNA-binding transcriptional regulator/antitoxin component of YhaV-PrlF toxin-antitoxin module